MKRILFAAALAASPALADEGFIQDLGNGFGYIQIQPSPPMPYYDNMQPVQPAPLYLPPPVFQPLPKPYQPAEPYQPRPAAGRFNR